MKSRPEVLVAAFAIGSLFADSQVGSAQPAVKDMSGQYLCAIRQAAGIMDQTNAPEYSGILNTPDSMAKFSVIISHVLYDNSTRQVCAETMSRYAQDLLGVKPMNDKDFGKYMLGSCVLDDELIMNRGGQELKYGSRLNGTGKNGDTGMFFESRIPGNWFYIQSTGDFVMGDLYAGNPTVNGVEVENGTCIKLTKSP
jgi:hypothetical protein